eukprot:scpid50673/ scgid10691/ Interferon-related developmental regulator 1
MPKREKKGKASAPRKRGGRTREREDDVSDDDCSVAGSVAVGNLASLSSDEEVNGDEAGAELIDDTRGRIIDCLEQTEHKSGKTKENGLSGLCQILSKTFTPDNVEPMQETLLATVVRFLKRGTDAEKVLSARLAAILMLQLGCADETEHYVDELRPLLSNILSDPSRSQSARAMASVTLALGNFMVGALPDHLELVDRFRTVLGTATTQSQHALVTAIISSWSVLLTDMTSPFVMNNADGLSSMFARHLGSKDPASRSAAGEAIAVTYEMARKVDPEFNGEDIEEVLASVKELAHDHSHHRSKTESKEGRAQFRPVVSYLEDGHRPDETVVVSKKQALRMTSWSEIRLLSFFKCVLGSGIHEHLRENEFIRDVFKLGASLGPDADRVAQTSDERAALKRGYNAKKMFRQVDRAAMRDKRAQF